MRKPVFIPEGNRSKRLTIDDLKEAFAALERPYRPLTPFEWDLYMDTGRLNWWRERVIKTIKAIMAR